MAQEQLCGPRLLRFFGYCKFQLQTLFYFLSFPLFCQPFFCLPFFFQFLFVAEIPVIFGFKIIIPAMSVVIIDPVRPVL
jgi:hypothetical protein